MTTHFTTADLASRWRRAPEWITEQARAGYIPGAWKLGRQWRFDPKVIETYEQSQRTDNVFALTTGAQRRRKTA